MGPDDNAQHPPGGGSKGVEHLQAAGRELIAAARAFLDVAEDAIEDTRVVEDAGALVRDVVQRLGIDTDRFDTDRFDTDGVGTDGVDTDGFDTDGVDLRDRRSGTFTGDEGDTGGVGPVDSGSGGSTGGKARSQKGSSRTRVRRIDVE
ncbi:MAG: hypothetical protein ACK5O2_01890 [Microthrixaceae bacterium]